MKSTGRHQSSLTAPWERLILEIIIMMICHDSLSTVAIETYRTKKAGINQHNTPCIAERTINWRWECQQPLHFRTADHILYLQAEASNALLDNCTILNKCRSILMKSFRTSPERTPNCLIFYSHPDSIRNAHESGKTSLCRKEKLIVAIIVH